MFRNKKNLTRLVNIFKTRQYSSIIFNRQKYMTPSLKTFEAFSDPFVIDKGYMQHIWDINGNKYIDVVGQNICVSVGHCHPVVVNKASLQMKKLAHCSSMYYNEQSALLAKKLVQKLPNHPSGEDWIVHFVNDGSEAVDLAVQMAREYTQRPEMISLYKGYHGLQGYAAGLTAIGKTTQNCHPSMYSSIIHVKPNSIDDIDNSIKYKTSGKIAGIIIEPLQGYGGIFPLENNYMKDAFSLVRNHGGITISDEVQTGYGRCGESFWGFQMKNNNVIPDMITIAKGMGNGVGIIGAVICKRSIAEAFSKKMFFNTYGSNPVSCSAALGVLEVMDNEGILNNSKNMGKIFTKEIKKLCNKYPEIYKEIRGQGLFQGLEIYGKNNEQSIENSIKLHEKTLKHGIIIGRGSAAGNVFRIQPPMCINKNDVMLIVNVLEEIAIERIKEINEYSGTYH